MANLDERETAGEAVSRVLLHSLKAHGANLFVSVPCKLLAGLIYLLDRDPDVRHLAVTREEEGVGISCGAFLSGLSPVMVIQNSGVGNSINALASLALYYELPFLMLISHRGSPGERIGAQVPMGRAVEPLLAAIGVPAYRFDDSTRAEEVGALVDCARVSRRPVAALLGFRFWEVPDR